MTILDEIIESKRREVERAKQRCQLAHWQAIAEGMPKARDFCQALKESAPKAIIAECKRRSPSKGLLCPDYDPVRIASQYQAAGAAAISVLTDEPYFGGTLAHLMDVSHAVDIPVLRKDFVVDEYQIHEARAHGADSFLLLANVLDFAQMQYFLEIGRDYGMEALVETHTEAEIDAVLRTDAKIIGINNRDLKTMTVNLATGQRLAEKVIGADREDAVLVCESGIKAPNDLVAMGKAGFTAYLVGEHLVTQGDIQKAFIELVGE